MAYNSKYTGAQVEEKLDKVDGKQDAISDLATIRAGAAKGVTALQSVPSEYVTESELTAKGYATTTQLAGKQDTIGDLATIRSGAALGATALQTETYKGTVTGIKMNGASKGTSGVVDLGTVITAHQDISGKQDKLTSGSNIKTINNTSILGSGNISIPSYDDTEIRNKITQLEEDIAAGQQGSASVSGETLIFSASAASVNNSTLIL